MTISHKSGKIKKGLFEYVNYVFCYKRESLVPGGWLLNFPVCFVDETWNYPLGIINSDTTYLQNNGQSKLLLYSQIGRPRRPLLALRVVQVWNSSHFTGVIQLRYYPCQYLQFHTLFFDRTHLGQTNKQTDRGVRTYSDKQTDKRTEVFGHIQYKQTDKLTDVQTSLFII